MEGLGLSLAASLQRWVWPSSYGSNSGALYSGGLPPLLQHTLCRFRLRRQVRQHNFFYVLCTFRMMERFGPAVRKWSPGSRVTTRGFACRRAVGSPAEKSTKFTGAAHLTGPCLIRAAAVRARGVPAPAEGRSSISILQWMMKEKGRRELIAQSSSPRPRFFPLMRLGPRASHDGCVHQQDLSFWGLFFSCFWWDGDDGAGILAECAPRHSSPKAISCWARDSSLPFSLSSLFFIGVCVCWLAPSSPSIWIFSFIGKRKEREDRERARERNLACPVLINCSLSSNARDWELFVEYFKGHTSPVGARGQSPIPPVRISLLQPCGRDSRRSPMAAATENVGRIENHCCPAHYLLRSRFGLFFFFCKLASNTLCAPVRTQGWSRLPPSMRWGYCHSLPHRSKDPPAVSLRGDGVMLHVRFAWAIPGFDVWGPTKCVNAPSVRLSRYKPPHCVAPLNGTRQATTTMPVALSSSSLLTFLQTVAL